MSSTVRLIAALSASTAASQFHRAALGVVGPEMAADLASGPGLLGAANGVFFLALLILQVPVGVALDRFGPRLTVAALLPLAVLGGLGQALAPDSGWFLAARFILGAGCAACFMGTVVVSARWYDGEGLTTAMARVFAFSQAGILLGGAPFGWVAEATGWRGAYALGAALTALVWLAWWHNVQDYPPHKPRPVRVPESLGRTLLGQLEVWRIPGLLPVMSMHLVGYAGAATVIAVWAGPYLAQVHVLAPGPRGVVLALMGLALPLGFLMIGPIERRLNTRKWLVVPCALLCTLFLAGLALWPHAPLPIATLLMVLLCFAGTFPIVVVAHGRALYPDHMVGRGATTVNLAQTLGAGAMPALTGWVVEAAPPALTWTACFGTLALAMALGVAGYLFSKDKPPRSQPRAPALPR